MADLKVDIATVFSGKKAFADAAKATIGLNNQVKTLAKSYLGLFTVQRLARSQYNAAKAFAADDKAARTLSRSLDNLGLAYADPSVRNFIADLEKQFGVLDDQLRPAFQRLLTTTGDVAKSQSLLRTALDLSAASGQDVVTVAGDLSKGYVGQTRALAKYGIGLTQAQLKAMSFEEVQARINSLFGGQAQVAVDTYAGKFDRLNVALKNAQETLGKGVLDSLSAIGGGNTQGFDNTLNFIDSLAQKAAKFERNFGVGIGQFLAVLRGDLAAAKALGEGMGNSSPYMGSIPSIQSEVNKKIAWDRINQYKKEAALQAKLLAAKKAELKAAKDQEALKKAGTLFDIQQASIIAALKGKITDEERTRLELQLAILTGNTVEASKLAEQLGKAQGLTESLRKYLADVPSAKNPFEAWKLYLDAIEAQARRIAGITPAAPVSIAGNNTSGVFSPAVQEMIAASTPSAGVSAGGDVNVYVAGSVVSEADLVEAVSNGLLNRSLSGSPSAIGRLKGSFTA
jgi:hypothetical protein